MCRLTDGAPSLPPHSHTSCISAPCFYRGSNGRLGITGTTQQTSPTLVVGGLAFQIGSISAGYYHTCALTTAGAGVCWGAYKSVSSVDTTAPAYISGGYTFAQITAGYEYSLGLLSNGTLIAWGSNAQY